MVKLNIEVSVMRCYVYNVYNLLCDLCDARCVSSMYHSKCISS